MEAQNRKLSADLEFLRSRWGKDTTSVKEMYELDLKQAYKIIKDTNNQSLELQGKILLLQEEIQILHSKYFLNKINVLLTHLR